MTDKSPVTVPAYVGLDISLTATGFSMKRGAELQIETVKTTPKTHPCDLERLRYIRKRLMGLIPDSTRMVCVEDFFVPQRASQMGAAKGLIMAGTLVRVALLERGLPFYVVSPGQLKKFATGKGSGPKSIVVREVYKRWGVDVKDDNQADSTVLAYMAEAIHLQPDFELLKYQQDTVDKVMADRPHYNV
jgi:crossover junction endodeoxyribonuclease RuvC